MLFSIKYHYLICSPSVYDLKSCQKEIDKSRKLQQNRWIFDVDHSIDEYVICKHDQFTLCRDILKTENKYLIIYKDPNLRTIRDLRECHIDLLLDSINTTMEYMKTLHDHKNWSIYFNYFPSNFQLHAHVVPNKSKVFVRSHNIHRVIKNLRRDGLHYANALIFTRIARSNDVFPVYQKQFSQVSEEVNICMSK